jgi:hypothetical protein
MAGFYDHLSPEDVTTLDRLARLLIELRESRAVLLARHGADSEAALLEKIRRGDLPEHPAYDDYLGARVIHATREAIRADLREYLLRINVS